MYDNVLLIGDFNINLSAGREFAEKTQFNNLVNNLNMFVLPLQPTYHLPRSDSLLDLIITNDVDRVNTFGQIQVSGISYHDLVYVELNLKVKQNVNKEPIFVRDFKNVQLDSLKQECLTIDWNRIYRSENIDDKVELLNYKLDLLFNKYIPERKISKKRNPCPWINNQLKLLMKDRDTLYKRYLRTKNPVNWDNYRVCRNNVKRQLRDARNRHFSTLLSSDKSSKDKWNILKSQGAGKVSKRLTEPVVNLDNLNEYFCGIDNHINVDLIQYYRDLKHNYGVLSIPFSFREFTCDDIFRVLSDVSSNAVGSDGVQLKFVKLIFD